MTVVEAVLLLIGVVFFIGSFFITEKLSPADVNKVAELSEGELRVLVDRELDTARAKVSDVVDEAMDLTIDKVQRTMERDTNEKIMAISEYSDATMEQLKKINHEVTFLYSMLGDKHAQLNEAMEQMDELIRIYQSLRAMPMPDVQAVPAASEPVEPVVQPVQTQTEAAPQDEELPQEVEIPEEEPKPVSVREQILERYHAGEDLTDIARDLGLGFGEVKLIVELYRGEEES